jgi:hypothetical protein
MDASSSQSLLSKFTNELTGLVRDHFHKQKPRLPLKLRTFRDLMQVMIEILSSLPNLRDYHCHWSGLTSAGDRPTPVISSPFKLSLRCIRLEFSLEKFQHMLSCHSQPLPDSVQELDLFIRVEHLLDSDRYDIILLMLAQMISSLHSSLRHLTIQLWEPFNLSLLFAAISHLPLLDKLSLSIPMSFPNMGDPAGLIGFLSSHSTTLRSLSIRASELGGRSLIPNEIQLGEWMDQTFSKLRLSCITHLDISLYLVPFESALLCVRRFSSTLTSLTLTGSHLAYEELEQLAASFPSYQGKLQYARLGPLTLSPQLMDMLSFKFPEIQKLELIVKSVVPFEGDIPLFLCPLIRSNDGARDQDEGQFARFVEEMSHRRYPDWSLRHLDVSSHSYSRMMDEDEYRGVFMRCIPSLRTFI